MFYITSESAHTIFYSTKETIKKGRIRPDQKIQLKQTIFARSTVKNYVKVSSSKNINF